MSIVYGNNIDEYRYFVCFKIIKFYSTVDTFSIFLVLKNILLKIIIFLEYRWCSSLQYSKYLSVFETIIVTSRSSEIFKEILVLFRLDTFKINTCCSYTRLWL